jgi:hypothetical protein
MKGKSYAEITIQEAVEFRLFSSKHMFCLADYATQNLKLLVRWIPYTS